MAAVGVDACKAGWLAVRLAPESEPEIQVYPDIGALWNAWGSSCYLVLIDVPIGLEASSACRACDAEARRLLGSPRASSVFNPPIRSAISASDWEEAAAINEAATGKRISQQGWGIVPKIREVDEFLRRDASRQDVVREVHPEVLFWALNGGRPLTHAKKRPEGIEERLGILDRHYPGAPEVAQQAFESLPRSIVQRDDVVDALAAAITAFRFHDRLKTLPTHPQHDVHGLRMEMVVPDVTISPAPPVSQLCPQPMRLASSTNELPSRPAVYAMYGGHGTRLHVAYVGIGGNLRQRVEQHLVRRDSSVTTGASVVSLNPDLVTRVRWWEHARFDDRDALLAAELVAFDVLQPVLRSRAKVTEGAGVLYASEAFGAEMSALFRGEPTGELRVTTLNGVAERLRALEERVSHLEGR